MEGLIRSNTLNRTGVTNYNNHGMLDGIGFANVTDKFADNGFLYLITILRIYLLVRRTR